MIEKVTTTNGSLELYSERNLSSTVIARVREGVEIHLGVATLIEGREWIEATVGDNAGYVLGPSARSNTTLGATGGTRSSQGGPPDGAADTGAAQAPTAKSPMPPPTAAVRSPRKKVSRIFWVVVAGAGFLSAAFTVTYVATEPQETLLGPIGVDSQLSPVISNDGRHLAYVRHRGKKQFVVVDGEAGVANDFVADSMLCAGTCANGSSKGSLIFSPDSKRLAYAARNRTWSVVLDNRPGPEHALVDKLIFSPDSKRFAYLALRESAGAISSNYGTAFNTQDGALYGLADGARLAAVVDGQVGPEYDVFLRDSLIFSPDSKHLAYAAGNGRRWSVVADGQRGPAYDGIGKDSLIFSPDSKRVAYAAKNGRKWSAVVDGQRGPGYDGIGRLTFSPNSKRVAYWAEESGKKLVMVDGDPSQEYGIVDINSPVFSPDSKRVAYAAKDGQKWSVVVDGQRGPEYDGIGRPIFSPNSKRVAYGAYTATKGKEQLVVVDDKPGPECDGVGEGGPIFSPDSKHMAYFMTKGGKEFVVVDDHVSAAYDAGLNDSLIFSPDSKRFAYAARNGQKWFVVADGQAGPGYESMLNAAPVFTPNSKHLAYAARNDRKWFVVVDGRAGPEYDAIFTGSLDFSPDGILGYLALREDSLYRVKLTPTPFLAGVGLVLRRVLPRAARADPYDGMVGALHRGMSSDDVVNALGPPCQRIEDKRGGWTYLHYLKPGTNMLLVISISGYSSQADLSRTINDWAILVPQSRDRPDAATAYPTGDGSVCSLGQGCSLNATFNERGVTTQGISCADVHYEVVKEQSLRQF